MQRSGHEFSRTEVWKSRRESPVLAGTELNVGRFSGSRLNQGWIRAGFPLHEVAPPKSSFLLDQPVPISRLRPPLWAGSSVAERCLYTADVAGSTPVPPTKSANSLYKGRPQFLLVFRKQRQ